MDEIDPDQLMRRFQERGDLDALGGLFDAVAPDLLGVARRVSGDAAEAEDLVHAAFLVAIEKPERWRGDASVTAWLAGILSKEALNARRRAARRLDPVAATLGQRLREERERPAEASEGAETRSLVARAIEGLPRLYREVVERHLAHDETPSEIARAIDAPASTVRVRLHRGLARLRERLPAGAFGALPALGGFDGLEVGARGLAALRADVVEHAASAGATVAAAAVTTGAAVTSGTTTGTASAASIGAGSGAGLLTLSLMSKRLLLVAAAVLATVGVLRVVSLDRAGAGRSNERDATRIADLEPVDVRALEVPDIDGAARLLDPASSAAVAPAPTRAMNALVRVLWADGTPAAGVAFDHVQFGDAAPDKRSARTNALGEALLADLTPGFYALYGDRGGHFSFTAAGFGGLGPAPTTTYTWTLPEGTDVRGRVVDAEGAGVAGAEVWVTTGLDRDAGRVAATTDAGGAFLLRQLGKPVFLGARRSGYAPSRAEHVGHWVERAEASDGAQADGIELELVLPCRGAALRGSVVGVGGAPLAGARVRIGAQWLFDTYGPSGAEGPPPPVEVVADARGQFSWDGAAPGAVQWACSAETYAVSAGTADVEEGAGRSIVIRMEPGARVRGRVVDGSGAGVPDVWVSARELGLGGLGRPVASSFDSPRVQTDAAGEYALFPLAAGQVDVTADADGGEGAARASVEVAVGEERTLDLVLQGIPLITGDARGVDGAPLAGWTVVTRASGSSSAPPRAVRTATDGTFTIQQPGRGAVDLRLYRPDASGSAWATPSAPVATLEGVAIGAEGVRLVADPAAAPRARITGRLAEPAAGAIVRASQSGLGDVGLARVEAGGVEFGLDALPAGDLTLTFEAEGRARITRRVEALETDEVRDVGEVALPPAGALRIVAERADGRAPERTNLQLVGPGGASFHATPEAGSRSFLARDLPVGEYRIRVHAQATAAANATATVREGEQTEVRLELRPGAPLGIAICGPDETPLDGPVALVVTDAAGAILVEEDLTPSPLGLATRWLPAPFGEIEISFGPVGGRRSARTITHGPGNTEPMRFELAR